MRYCFLFYILFICLPGCTHPQIDGGVTKKTFVLSDTMLKTIRIDTASLRPVLVELHFSGKVSENEKRIVTVAASGLSSVTPGLSAEVVTASLPDKVFHGIVINALTDTSTQTGELSIRLNDDGKELKPDMFTKVILHCDEGDDMIAVPETAVIEDHDKNFVLVFKDKYNIQLREVETYTTSGDVTYISKGLSAGENVISAHQQQIYDALSDN
jgi:membrane fusion protein, heavy metal efflux system